MRPLILVAILLAGCASPADERAPRAWACGPCAAALEGAEAPVWEPSAAVSPVDPEHVVVAYRDASSTSIVTSVTQDGGATWAKGGLAVGDAAAPGSPAREWTHTGDAVVAVGPDGRVRLAGLGFRYAPDPAGGSYERTGASIFVATSADGGLSFPEVSVVARGGGSVLGASGTPAQVFVDYRNEDKEWLAIGSDGTLLVAWTALRPGTGAVSAFPRPEPNTLYASVSRDGASWSEPVVLEAEGSPSGAYPYIAADGAMHVAYRHYDVARSFVATSRDGGATWETVEVGEARGQPTLDALPDGTLLLAFPASAGEDATAPAIARSTDGARTWSRAKTLDVPTEGRTHVSLDVGPDGVAYAGWYSEGAGGKYRVAVLRDGEGATTIDVGPAEPPWNVYGDYVTGVVAQDAGFLAIWNHDAGEGPTLQRARYVYA